MSDTTITWADLTRLTKAAKAAKSDFPDLTHAQRLNVLASRTHGVRNYHEMLKRYQASIEACLVKDKDVHTCRLCGLQFDASEDSDVKQHAERHELYEEAKHYLGYSPALYADRERTKKLGYEWLHSDYVQRRKHGAQFILLAHFERSLDAAIEDRRWRRHPFFDEYVQCALADAPFLPDDVRRLLVADFGERPGVLPTGRSYWPRDVERRSSDGTASFERLQSLRALATAQHSE